MEVNQTEDNKNDEIVRFFEGFGKEALESFLWSVYVFSRYPEDSYYINIMNNIKKG